MAIALSGGLFCLSVVFMFFGRGSSIYARLPHQENWAASRRERAKNIKCNPKITESIPLAPKILSNGTTEFDPTVIILSFDGFRAEYLNRGLTPNMLSVGKMVAPFWFTGLIFLPSHRYRMFRLMRMILHLLAY